MKAKTIVAADFKQKPYAKPMMKVVEIEDAEIICTSDKGTFRVYGPVFEEEEDW